MTETEYWIEVRDVKKAYPNSDIIPVLERGHNLLAEKLLQRLKATNACDDQSESAESPVKSQGKPAPGASEHIARLLGERAKLSNQFHDCSTDEERKELSQKIRVIDNDIRKIKTGTFREVEQKPSMPEGPVALMRKLNSVRAMISQNKRKIKALKRKPEGAERNLRIQECTGRIEELEHEKQILSNAIKESDNK